MLAAMMPPTVICPSMARNTPQTTMATLTACWMRPIRLMLSCDQKRVHSDARKVAATASSKRRCMMLSAPAAFTVSIALSDSISTTWRRLDWACEVFTARASGHCRISVRSSTTGSAATTIQVTGPTRVNITATITPTNSRSVTATTDEEAKKSRTVSNSRIWLASAPGACCRSAIGRASACRKRRAKAAMSICPPAWSRTPARNCFSKRSNTRAMSTPAVSAHSVGWLWFGITRS